MRCRFKFHFNEHIFRLEQEEYAREGVLVPRTAHVDNQPCLDLLELRGDGVFAMIDEEISVPKVGFSDGVRGGVSRTFNRIRCTA
jgi:myosin heavy subunit